MRGQSRTPGPHPWPAVGGVLLTRAAVGGVLLTLAALGGTLALYLDPERAVREVPVLAMLREPVEAVRARAERLAALWRGEIREPALDAVVTGTAAIAIRLMGRAREPAEAQALAEAMWRERCRHLAA